MRWWPGGGISCSAWAEVSPVEAALCGQAFGASERRARGGHMSAAPKTPRSTLNRTSVRFRSFLVLWLGQVASVLGTSLSGFAVGIWVYESTGSVTQFAIIALTTALPRVLLAPIAGAFVDRWDRKRMLLFGDTGAACGTLGILLLLWLDALQPWHVFLATALASACSAAQAPAYAASVPLLVPERQLGRANGMIQFGEAAARIAAPLMAAALLGVIGLRGIVLIDLATFVYALGTLLMVPIPSPERSASAGTERSSVLDDIRAGARYLRGQRGLLALMGLFTVSNFFLGMVEVLVTPLVLATHTPLVLSQVMTIGGVGMLLGSLSLAAWGGPRRRALGVLGFMVCEGAFMMLGGLSPQFVCFAAAAFGFFSRCRSRTAARGPCYRAPCPRICRDACSRWRARWLTRRCRSDTRWPVRWPTGSSRLC